MVRKVYVSDDDDDSGEDTIALEEVARIRRRSKSEKQKLNDEGKSEKEMSALRKKLAKYEKKERDAKTEKAQNENYEEAHVDSDGVEYESEEQDPKTINFAPAQQMKPLGSFPQTPPKNLRRERRTKGSSSGSRALSQLTNSILMIPSSKSSSTSTPADANHKQAARDNQSPARQLSSSPSGTPEQRSHRSHSGKKRDRSLSPPRLQDSSSPPTKQAKFREGQEPNGRAKLADYKEPAASMLLAAVNDYECRVYTQDPYPDAEEQVALANNAWAEICKESNRKIELTDRMLGLIKSRGSHARGVLVTIARPHVVLIYGFSRSDSRKSRDKNMTLSSALLEEHAFHYKDVETLVGFAQNKIISHIIQEAWFKKITSDGVVYSKYFDPISLETMALVFAVIEFCIREFSTGTFKQLKFTESENKARYEVHLAQLREWQAVNPQVVGNIRKKMHDRARKSTGAGAINGPKDGLSEAAKARAKAELEGRTGDTDSEASEGE